MQTLRMKTEFLATFLHGLKPWGTLYAPAERAPGVFSLEPLDEDVPRARPDALRTIVPFKKLLLKPRFAMLEQRGGGLPEESADNDFSPRVFFGAHACDIHALKITDLMYLTDFADPYYRKNRESLTVIGYGCMPDDKCFCHSVGTSNVDEGFDLFLTPLEGRFLVTIGSARGDDIVRANAALFEASTPQDTRDYLDRLKVRENSFTLSMDVTDLPYVLELKKDDPVWDELGKKCLCCGSCSMVCPTCTCFNVADEIPKEGSAARVRFWDACLYRDYAVVAGGHNFRGNRADRVKNRYYHKQEAFVREFGMPSCVGCGRCIENCPTGINVVEVFRYVRGEL
jgi:sulfhydrogenase subunit beta (sulfur reductase)